MFSKLSEEAGQYLKQQFPAVAQFYPWGAYDWVVLTQPIISLIRGKHILSFYSVSGELLMKISCSVRRRNQQANFLGVKGRIIHLVQSAEDIFVEDEVPSKEVRIVHFKTDAIDAWVMFVAKQPAAAKP